MALGSLFGYEDISDPSMVIHWLGPPICGIGPFPLYAE